MQRSFLLYFFLLLAIPNLASAQQEAREGIEWLSFEALDKVFEKEPKPVVIYFYADWCAYCKKMQRNAFQNPEVIKYINENYYAVKMDAESKDVVVFDGKEFNNLEQDKKRNPKHELALLLASRNGQVVLPALIVTDSKFNINYRSFSYLTGSQLLQLLKKNMKHQE